MANGTKRVGSGELRSATQAVGGLIRGRVLPVTAVRFSDLDGLACFEGDILLGRSDALRAAAERGQPFELGGMGAGITGQQYRWPKALVPFQIDTRLPGPQRVLLALQHWEANTPIRFVERTGANFAKHPDYLSFEPGDGCSSYVGRQGDKQEILLASACGMGNVVHEIGHAVGLWHEQSREDRDQYVEVHLEHVMPGVEHNFDQHVTDGDDLGPYDYESIMHYPRDAFSADGQDTIVPRGGQAIGQRQELSEGDVLAVKALYP